MSDSTSTTVDVDAWVRAAQHNPAEQRVRRVMRIVLFAVAHSPLLKNKMVIKGGVLLALKYGTYRHTRDLDFSTPGQVQQEDTATILAALGRALGVAARTVDPEIRCNIQSSRMQPPRPDASFPTLRIKVGYALQGEKAYQRMVRGGDSPDTITVDLSFNESTCITSRIVLSDRSEVIAYSLFDQIAEKYRALIQQTADRRDRVRRQDVYDIFRVIEQGFLTTPEDKTTLLDTMVEKFAARDVPLFRETIDEPEIAERSRREYARLQDEIDGDLPDFDRVFKAVRDYYRSLPWLESK